MTTPLSRSFAWQLGRWLIVLQFESITPARMADPPDETCDLPWDILASQYGVPVSPDGRGLQMCALCCESVAPDSGKFLNRRPIGSFAGRVAAGYAYPAGAYLCAACHHREPLEANPPGKTIRLQLSTNRRSQS